MAQSDWSLDRHTHKTEHARTITRNASWSVLSTCIRAQCASAMAASPRLLQYFHFRLTYFTPGDYFHRSPRLSAMPECARSEVLHLARLPVHVTTTVFHSLVVYGFSNKDYGYCASTRTPLEGTFRVILLSKQQVVFLLVSAFTHHQVQTINR